MATGKREATGAGEGRDAAEAVALSFRATFSPFQAPPLLAGGSPLPCVVAEKWEGMRLRERGKRERKKTPLCRPLAVTFLAGKAAPLLPSLARPSAAAFFR
jgi:hypothetical protein